MSKKEVTCKYCGRRLVGGRALKDHIKAKHKPQYLLMTVVPYLVIVLVIAFASAAFLPQYLEDLRNRNTATEVNVNPEDILNRFLTPTDRLIKHIHVFLSIRVDNQEITIPPGIGIVGGREKYMHTHDDSGIIHIETPIDYPFTLGDFFKVWDKRFDENCVGEYCGNVTVIVNGQNIETPWNYVLENQDNITIEVDTGK
ncbi:MAG TPA: hypothetical protein EYH45_07480 [Candidatus Caldiarchaeum subterraneum]|uniref:C2H2-type domain-containing protein n=1 Tax=Caldiarchaeum subterraneum TaxID=311458 RepID=A0A832ZWY8_CALS0|nr:hypothetical protein [Candidatus Caldarchaeum subterraneum]